MLNAPKLCETCESRLQRQIAGPHTNIATHRQFVAKCDARAVVAVVSTVNGEIRSLSLASFATACEALEEFEQQLQRVELTNALAVIESEP